jgi:FtsH-binding integral membrane protein
MYMITLRDAMNRSYNLLGVAVIAISGLAFSSDLPAEIDQFTHIVDEVLLAVLAFIAVVWYLMGRNKYSHTLVPILFAGAALAMKVLGLVLEFADPEDRGDEFGALVLFSVLVIDLIWQFVASGRMAAQSKKESLVRIQEKVHTL